ncbi:MAG: thioredoxin-disulfide reductase [Treponema sp.]|jgi:thioredoxin reductase (NADPH)|nr:thioredoxin-disulfide reductase [Treponema sp.]
MTEKTADLLIIGAGPAGLTAAQYGARANLSVLVIEQLAPGGQVLNIDVLENYPGNVGIEGGPGPKSGYDFAQDMHRQAESFGAAFCSGSVTGLRKEGGRFSLELADGRTLQAGAVICAAGAQHRKLEIPGEEEFSGRGVSYCATCDGPFFRGKKIFVVGGGDAACDEACYLSRLSPRVVLIHRRDQFRAQKALAERTLKNPHIEVRFNTIMKEIRGEAKVKSVRLEKTDSREQYEDDAEAVFVFTGIVPQTAALAGLGGLEFDANGYIRTDQNMATSVPGLFAAGDVRSSPFRQVVVAAGEGAVAAHKAAEYLDSL